MFVRVLKLIAVMCLLLALWVLLIWMVVTSSNHSIDALLMVILTVALFAILFVYTNNIVYFYVVDVCNKYNENKIKDN